MACLRTCSKPSKSFLFSVAMSGSRPTGFAESSTPMNSVPPSAFRNPQTVFTTILVRSLLTFFCSRSQRNEEFQFDVLALTGRELLLKGLVVHVSLSPQVRLRCLGSPYASVSHRSRSARTLSSISSCSG